MASHCSLMWHNYGNFLLACSIMLLFSIPTKSWFDVWSSHSCTLTCTISHNTTTVCFVHHITHINIASFTTSCGARFGFSDEIEDGTNYIRTHGRCVNKMRGRSWVGFLRRRRVCCVYGWCETRVVTPRHAPLLPTVRQISTTIIMNKKIQPTLSFTTPMVYTLDSMICVDKFCDQTLFLCITMWFICRPISIYPKQRVWEAESLMES